MKKTYRMTYWEKRFRSIEVEASDEEEAAYKVEKMAKYDEIGDTDIEDWGIEDMEVV